MRFGWDTSKEKQALLERGIDFTLATEIFLGPTIAWRDDRRDYGELRMRALGEVDGLVLHVVFTDRADLRRIISARMANKKERLKWRSRP